MGVKPRDAAPDWIKADLVINVAAFTVFINDHAKPDGTVHIQVKEGKTGKWYASFDQWASPQEPVEPVTDRSRTRPFLGYASRNLRSGKATQGTDQRHTHSKWPV